MDPEVTIIIIPHERYNVALRSLDSIIEYTRQPYNLVYVDVNSPPYVYKGLKKRQKKHGFKWIRKDYFIQPNEARNLGLEHVSAPYVVFIDNDVIVTEGWLDALIRCAKETHAWLVGPLILESDGNTSVIHSGVTKPHINKENGILFNHNVNHLDDLGSRLIMKRMPSELLEYHCILMNMEGLKAIGGKVDEEIKNTRSHMDLCFSIKKAGGKIYFEPESQVNFMRDYPIKDKYDEEYIKFRYEDSATIKSIHYFEKKWNVKLEPDRLNIKRGRKRQILNNKKDILTRLGFKNNISVP